MVVLLGIDDEPAREVDDVTGFRRLLLNPVVITVEEDHDDAPLELLLLVLLSLSLPLADDFDL